MNKLYTLLAKHAPTAVAGAANLAAVGSIAKLGHELGTGQALDSYAKKALGPGELLGLQEETDKATLRALLSSNLLAAGHRTSMSIINNIGK